MKMTAIQLLYPNIVSLWDSEKNGFTGKDKDNKDVVIDMSAVEIKAEELKTEKENNRIKQEELKASAKAKLIAGEPLTEEEANTIVL